MRLPTTPLVLAGPLLLAAGLPFTLGAQTAAAAGTPAATISAMPTTARPFTVRVTGSGPAVLLIPGLMSGGDAAEVLRDWTQETPQLDFPHRRIARLDTGYEASVLALTCNPLTTFSCTDSIAYRMRQGRALPSAR